MSLIRKLLLFVLGISMLGPLGIGCASRKPEPFVYMPPRATEQGAGAMVRSDQRENEVNARSSRRGDEIAEFREDEELQPEQRRSWFGRGARADAEPEIAQMQQPGTPSPTLDQAQLAEPDNPSRDDDGTGSGRRWWPFGGDPEDADEDEGGLTAIDSPDFSPRIADPQLMSDDIEMQPDLTAGYRLRPGDQIIVHLRGIPEPANYEYVIDDTGYINLPYIPPVRAMGLTTSELQQQIHDSYIEERIYRQISVNVINPLQKYFMQGEVRQPGSYPLTSGMTLLRAIAAAGGYTEFAQPRRVELTRDGETIRIDARDIRRNPERDVELKAGDVIDVQRSFF